MLALRGLPLKFFATLIILFSYFSAAKFTREVAPSKWDIFTMSAILINIITGGGTHESLHLLPHNYPK
jgi:hypothetical protein